MTGLQQVSSSRDSLRDGQFGSRSIDSSSLKTLLIFMTLGNFKVLVDIKGVFPFFFSLSVSLVFANFLCLLSSLVACQFFPLILFFSFWRGHLNGGPALS